MNSLSDQSAECRRMLLFDAISNYKFVYIMLVLGFKAHERIQKDQAANAYEHFMATHFMLKRRLD